MKLDLGSALVGAAIAIIVIAIVTAIYVDYQRRKIENFLRSINRQDLVRGAGSLALDWASRRLNVPGQISFQSQ
jgi:hypothetical protein